MTDHEHPQDPEEGPPEDSDLGLETTERAHREAEEHRYFLAETSEGAQEIPFLVPKPEGQP